MPTYTGQRMMEVLPSYSPCPENQPQIEGIRSVARVFTIPVVPDPKRRRTPRISDKRYIQGQKVLVEAMKYLVQSDANGNREAVGLLSEHFRTQFRMSDRPAAE
jgi:hypothetical protein